MTERYLNLAERLRLLWPAGNKTPNCPWRDSAKDIAKLLEKVLGDNNLTDVSDEDILRVAMVYVNDEKFSEDRKYMRALRYYICKQKIINHRTVCDSLLVPALEALKESEAAYESVDNIQADYGEMLG